MHANDRVWISRSPARAIPNKRLTPCRTLLRERHWIRTCTIARQLWRMHTDDRIRISRSPARAIPYERLTRRRTLLRETDRTCTRAVARHFRRMHCDAREPDAID